MMSTVKLVALSAAAVILTAAFTMYNYDWKIAKGYSVKFTTASASGRFEKISGTIKFDENNLAASSFSVNAAVSSITTGNFLKNRHARGENWLDAKHYPAISFVSDNISKTDTGYMVTGNLTMHGVTHPVNIPFTFLNSTFTGNFSVNRSDYNVGSLEGMSKTVGDKIDLSLSIPVTK